ncbi:MAG TPA: class I SAM-dependent methyltransferase [Ktedonobacteraceae bacterium]|nr:class I SAM-dependent methyltransferase [Ktedonobacteraceae bacterium]
MSQADLRHPVASQERTGDRWSQWSSPSMIEMSALDTYQFVKTMLPASPQRILEVGCGNGYLTLELARNGHTVVGLDQSPDILAVAEDTRKAHPDTPGFGQLDYVCAEIGAWPITEGSFDVVIVNRTLHHLHDFLPILAKIQRLLVPKGLFICQDYA